MLLVNQL